MTTCYLKPGERKHALRVRLTTSDKHRLNIIASRYEGVLGSRPSASLLMAMALDALADRLERDQRLPRHPSLRPARDGSSATYGA